MNNCELMIKGMDNFVKRVEEKKRLYSILLHKSSDSKDRVFRITDEQLLYRVLNTFGTALDHKKAEHNLSDIYDAAIHKETGALLIPNKGPTLYSLTPRR